MDYLSQHIEALIFSAPKTIRLEEIKSALESAFDTKIKKKDIVQSIEEIKAKYQDEQYAFEVVEIAEGFQFLSKPLFFDTIGAYIKQEAKRRLSKAALETLAIIAYKGPVSKSEAEKIRGVSCDYTVQKLLEKELVEITGRAEGPGRPLLYATSKKFLDYFGISGKKDLPQLRDFAQPDQEVGEKKSIEEVPQVEGATQTPESQEVETPVVEEESVETPLEGDPLPTLEAESTSEDESTKPSSSE